MDTRLYEFTPPVQHRLWGPPDGGKPIRKFSDENIQAAIERAVERAGSKHGAVVAHIDDEKNVSLSVVGRVGGHWSVAAAAFKPYHGKLSAAAEVVFDW